MATKWPNEVPVLEGKDFCRGSFTDGKCHCLGGWCYVALFGPDEWNWDSGDPRVARMCRAIQSAAKSLSAESAGGYVSAINDDKSNPLALLARIWNRATALLGYVVNNPEAKHLKRKGRG